MEKRKRRNVVLINRRCRQSRSQCCACGKQTPLSVFLVLILSEIDKLSFLTGNLKWSKVISPRSGVRKGRQRKEKVVSMKLSFPPHLLPRNYKRRPLADFSPTFPCLNSQALSNSSWSSYLLLPWLLPPPLSSLLLHLPTQATMTLLSSQRKLAL